MTRESTRYRIYADGTVVHEDDFEEQDNSLPYYDDYTSVSVPDAVVDYIETHVPYR